MTTTAITRPHPLSRKEQARRLARKRRRRHVWEIRALVLLLVAALALMFWALGREAGTRTVAAGARAPAFSLPATDGRTVSLAGLAGSNALLYFSEGAGCDPCFTQMVEIERSMSKLDALGVRFVPVMTNAPDVVRAEMRRFGLTSAVAIDSSKDVSRAYDTLGRGHHADLPGHSFILIDKTGAIRWRGDYPSMYVATAKLLDDIANSLRA